MSDSIYLGGQRRYFWNRVIGFMVVLFLAEEFGRELSLFI
jgi:hypothetical protein